MQVELLQNAFTSLADAVLEELGMGHHSSMETYIIHISLDCKAVLEGLAFLGLPDGSMAKHHVNTKLRQGSLWMSCLQCSSNLTNNDAACCAR